MLKRYFEALNLAYLSASRRMELAPFRHCHPELVEGNNWEVVKASSGHYPQPFLISIV
jgi:hypothetical protein